MGPLLLIAFYPSCFLLRFIMCDSPLFRIIVHIQSGQFIFLFFLQAVELGMAFVFTQVHIAGGTTIHSLFSFLQYSGVVFASFVTSRHSGAGMALKIFLVYQYSCFTHLIQWNPLSLCKSTYQLFDQLHAEVKMTKSLLLIHPS